LNELLDSIPDEAQGEEIYHEISETGAKFHFEVDSQARINYSSPHLLKILGFNGFDVRGNFFSNYVILSDLPKMDDAFQVATSGKRHEALRIKVKNKDGKIIRLETKLIPIFADRKVIGIRGIARMIAASAKE